jgi:beta-lactam-binding protein with PASTA domain
MTVADNTYGGGAFAEPDASAFRVVETDVPDVRGTSPTEARSILERASFTVVEGAPQNSDVAAGLVAGTSPSGSAPHGATIEIFVSLGPAVVAPPVAPPGKPEKPDKPDKPD